MIIFILIVFSFKVVGVLCKDGGKIFINSVCNVYAVFSVRSSFPFPSFNCLDTFPGMCETFDFNLKNDQNRFGLCSREVQIELMFPCGFHATCV